MLFLSFSLVGCMDQDPFFLGVRPIGNGYEINYSESGDYWLTGPFPVNNPHPINGYILHIGWNDKYIIVEHMGFYKNDANEWIAINMLTGEIISPLRENELSNFIVKKGIFPSRPEKAWQKLPLSPKGLYVPIIFVLLLGGSLLLWKYGIA